MTDNFENVRLLHEAYPDKHLVFTEGCHGTDKFGAWDTGEFYARSLIQDLNNYTEGWTDWNLLLDEAGGPNHVNNFCNAPIIADTKNDALIYQSSYYYLGHFSRFIRPGDKRVLCSTTLDELEATATLAPDGTVTVVVLNRSDKDLDYRLRCEGQAAQAVSPAHSIVTYQFNPV
jgi:glucosylceramidase